jgi:hypothetical protein
VLAFINAIIDSGVSNHCKTVVHVGISQKTLAIA